MSGNQQQAYDLAQQQSAGSGALQAAATTPYSTQAVAAYAQPYLQNVLQPQISAINQNYDQQRSALNSNPMSVAAQNAYNLQGNANNNAALNTAQNSATTNATALAMPAAFSYGQQALMACREQAQQIVNAQQGALTSTGQVAQNVQQAEDTFGYGQYLQGQQWSTQSLQSLLGSLQAAGKGAPQTATGATSGTQSQNSTGSAIGAAASIIGTVASFY